MSLTLSAIQMSDMSGLTAEEAGEVGSDSTVRDTKITEAIKQFERYAQRTFDGTEDDYSTAQEAVAFLTAHLISRKRLPAIAEGSVRSPYLDEYRRLLRNLKERTDDSKEKYFGGKVSSVETVDLSTNYKQDGHSQ